jgi:alginate production protein
VLEASLTVDRLGGSPFGFQIGRQRFRDAREWFFDEYLDAARLHVDIARWRFEAAAVSGVFAGPESRRERRDQRHAVVSAARQLGARTTATAFVIARDDRNRRERPIWIGGSVEGRATRNLKYWANGAVRRGRAGEIRLASWAADGAASYRLPLPGSPALSAGYAAASGDGSRSDGVDSNFRQTGLEDNTARFFGLKRFAYYGAVLDPELSNIEIVTAGSGFTPFRRASIDVVYHQYRQRHLRRSLPSNALEATGTGTSTEIGQELDLIISVQQFRPIDFSIVTGIFWPGSGIATPSRASRFWQPQIRLFF